MWNFVAKNILRYRFILILILLLLTIFMLYSARELKLSHTIVDLLPSDHPINIQFKEFQKKYGENNIILVGIEDSQFQKLEHIKELDKITDSIKLISGIEYVISDTQLPILVKDDKEKRFRTIDWYTHNISSQLILDSLYAIYSSQKFYSDLFDKKSNKHTILMIKIDNEYLLSSKRNQLVFAIKDIVDRYVEDYNLKVHYSGLPYIRVIDALKIRDEMFMFSFVILFITSLILFLFFRSLKATIASVFVVVLGVIWVFGTIAIFNYEISIIMALVPPVIIIIGIPNCIFLINKFHNVFKKCGSKQRALNHMIMKIGNITLLTNLTTASGFAAFILTKSETLQKFGVIASLNILFVFFISLVLIPIFFSYLSSPKESDVNHLNKAWVKKLILYLVYMVQYQRKKIYIVTIILTCFGIYGVTLIKTTGNITDDLDKNGVLYQDLKFFENNYGGIMPIEIIIDTKKKNGLFKSYNLKKIDELENVISKYKHFSKPVSYLSALKYSTQAFYNGDSMYYRLPNSHEYRILTSYFSKSNINHQMNSLLMDSLKREARVSLRMKDVNTSTLDSVLNDLKLNINMIFNAENYNVIITGISIVFLNGTKFLIKNLFTSLFLVIVLISIFMAWMFNSFRMVIVSIIPNMIPLLLTAAIMGYIGIPLKPSTILVFSIAFGISVDDTIHFLAKYHQELLNTNWDMKSSILSALKETGVSMFYTSIVLFFGFLIFIASSFGGTVAVGMLVSITLLLAMMANLLLLPALLLSLEKVIYYEAFREPLIDIFDEEEDIELEELQIKRKNK